MRVVGFVILIFSISMNAVLSQCPIGTCTYIYNGGVCNNVTLNPGQVLCIQSGTYSCQVNFNGGDVVIYSGAQFSPNNANNVRGKIDNCGTVTFGSATFDNTVEINNYGNIDLVGSVNFSGGSIYNGSTGVINFSTNFNIQGGQTVVNDGILNAGAEFKVSNGVFTNNFDLFTVGNFVVETSSASVVNTGRVISDNNININPGAVVSNSCSFIARGDIVLDEDIVNTGIMLGNGPVSRFNINSMATVTNNGTMIAQNMITSGTINGSGDIYIYESTTQNSPGRTGLDGLGLNFYDFTSSGQIYDVQQGIVDPSVTNNPPANPSDIPDENDFPVDCSLVNVCRRAFTNPHIMFYRAKN